ncbi:hypothetical protein F985_02735 [Acinetobacter seifertii]|uniref:Uncharacterized protein n=1 Tax=Acinetobacter seifertii TaxID=1530123 RepID=N8S2M1_9GAMM|nr:hypothetical protein F985_02735 [Acinetobacter seifertii]
MSAYFLKHHRIFNFIDKQEGKTIVEVIKEVKKAKDEIKNS